MATEEELDIGDLIIFEELTLDRNNDQSIVPQDGMERIDPKPHVVIFLAPNSSTIHPSPFNVNLKFLDEHMARAADFIIPENVLCEMKGWIRFLFDQVAMDYKVPCYRCGVREFYSKLGHASAPFPIDLTFNRDHKV
jgi:hypothetical protein